MTRSPLSDAFAHHTWATLRVIDACGALTPQQLETSVPGTYGSILDTLRHLAEADAGYLFVTGRGRVQRISADEMDLGQLRSVMQEHDAAWQEVVGGGPDPDEVLVRRRDDGSETHAPMGIRLAQVIHHGTDHRSQVCTALTQLGIEPPPIDVWDFAADHDRLTEIPPSS